MGKKLLLADDSITIQKVVGIIFANEDYELTIVDNGTAAMEKAVEVKPDVMLVDALMPGKSGYEVAEAVRRDPSLSTTPILLMTGAFEPFDETKATECGADDFISKPFESQQLIEKVKTLIDLGTSRSIAAPIAAPAAVVSPPAASANDLWELPEETAIASSATDGMAGGGFTTELLATGEEAAVSADDDLWGAFELEEVSEAEETATEVLLSSAPAPDDMEIDPFAFDDDRETLFPKADVAASVTGFSEENRAWQPVEEETFEFDLEPEPAAVVSPAVPEPAEALADFGFQGGGQEEEFDVFIDESARVDEETDFETFEFSSAGQEEIALSPASTVPAAGLVSPGLAAAAAAAAGVSPAPVVAEPPPIQRPFEVPTPPPVPAVAPPPAAPVQAPAGEVTLSEAQLASLVARISRDIIEKIAWEVVPDLAETLIKEEIRKIKEGQ
jgi:DNA-binding response OmpR family regulator